MEHFTELGLSPSAPFEIDLRGKLQNIFPWSENSLLFLGQWARVFCEFVFAHIC